ncbi:large ribosomal subunit protein uL22-like [Drosophila montana]|uniref:large ribosomal subunit protein uL22-like n=1 Tax=Drosophila montana TaxID=40370 RepID=UPI00313E0EF4
MHDLNFNVGNWNRNQGQFLFGLQTAANADYEGLSAARLVVDHIQVEVILSEKKKVVAKAALDEPTKKKLSKKKLQRQKIKLFRSE